MTMMSIYKHHAPSTTSLSDDADDGDEEAQFAFYADYQPSPAQWANKPQRPIQHPKRAFQHSPISTIPPEVLISILKHLHSPRDLFSCLRVSRAWCECTVELLWHKPAFSKCGTVHKMASLLRNQHQTFTYARFVRRLNFLNLGSDLMDDLLSVFARCDRLERLTLIGCNHITGELLAQVLPSFSHLVAIDLTGVVTTTSDSIIGLASVATRLQGINLAGCVEVTDAGIVALANSCPSLRRVKLSGLVHLTDESVSALAGGCPTLLELDLNLCELITDASVRLIWTHLNHMREMRLAHCALLTDAAFPSPLKLESYIEVPNPFPNSEQTGDLPPLLIAKSFDHLRMLDLTACPLVTDEAVEGIISHAPKIRNLVLSKCVLLSDKAVESICKLGRHLHYLHLGHASRITDRSVRILARSCTRIRYIDFANCVHLTDMSVFELSALPKLRRVGLVRVNQLTDEAIYSLAERHATLERIHLSYCDQISVMAIHFLLLKLHKLTHLSLTGVPAFRQPELQRFCREAPKDFNTAQRMSFCVFSGKGVSQLRTYLTELFDRITEMNNTDDTEYEEDDDDGDAYHEDDTPEPEGPGDAIEMDQYPRQHIVFDPAASPQRGTRTSYNQPVVDHSPRSPHEFAFQRDRPVRATAIPITAYNHEQHVAEIPQSPSTNLHGATSRLNAQIQATTPAANTSRRARAQPQPHRSAADAFPVIEASISPPSDIASNNSARTNNSNGAGFFRTYHERTMGVSPRGTGTLTPDLNYAEIGHGRGTQGNGNGQAHPTLAREQTPRQSSGVQLSAARPNKPPQIENSDSAPEDEDQLVIGAPDSTWASNQPTVTRRIQAVPQSSFGTDVRGRRENRGRERSSNPDGRARSVKRGIRNTFVAAEHYASSLLFGRTSADMQPEASGSGTASGTGTVPRHV